MPKSLMDKARDVRAKVMADKKIDEVDKRKAFVRSMEAKGASSSCASSYWQMLKREAEGGNMYEHHLTKTQRTEKNATKTSKVKKSASAAKGTDGLTVTKAKGKWQGTKKGAKKAYFTSRTNGQAYSKANGGGFKVEKIAA